MVKIKRAVSSKQLTTRTTAPLVKPESFTADIQTVEASAVLIQRKIKAIEDINNFNDATNARIRLGRRAFTIEQESKQDPDFKTISQRSSLRLNEALDEESQTINDPIQRDRFRLIGETQIQEAQRRIVRSADDRTLKAQRNDYELFLEDSVDRIHQFRFDDSDSDSANRLAAEVISITAEMENQFVLFPEVATARLEAFQKSVTQGQAVYDFDHAKTPAQFDVVEDRLKQDFYELGNTQNEILLGKLNSLRTRKAKEAKEVQEIEYLNNFRELLNNIGEPAEGKVQTDRQMILNAAARGEGEIEGGIPIGSAPSLIAILDEGDRIDKPTLTRKEDIQAFISNSILNDKYYALNLADNKNKTGANLAEARVNDAPLGQMKDFIRDVIGELDAKRIPVKDAQKYINAVMQEFSFRNNEEAAIKAEAKRSAWISYKQLMGIPGDIFKREVVDQTQKEATINNVRSDMVRQFFAEMEATAESSEVKGVLRGLKEQYANRTNRSLINVQSTPNGIVSEGRPAEEIFDEKSETPADLRLQTGEQDFKDGTDKQGNRFRIFFNKDGKAIRKVPVE